MQSAKIYNLSECKKMGKPLVLKELRGVPYKREIAICQFKQIDSYRFIAMNDAAYDFMKLVSCLGWVSEKTLKGIEQFAIVEREGL